MFCHVPFRWLRKRTCNKTLRGGQIFTLFLYFFYSNCVYHDFLIQLSQTFNLRMFCNVVTLQLTTATNAQSLIQIFSLFEPCLSRVLITALVTIRPI